jgi:D-3-phosphoglycerate dehydrogenase
MQLPIVVLTNPMEAGVAQALSRQFELRHAPATDADTLRAMARDAQYIVVRAPLPGDLFAAAPALRGVVRHGAGLDMIPVDKASDQGVAVANVPAVNARSVAEYAMGQMLSLARQLPEMEDLLRAGQWNAPRAAAEHLPDLHGKTVAIVGLGAIGRALAGMCTALRPLAIRSPSHPWPTPSARPTSSCLPARSPTRRATSSTPVPWRMPSRACLS